MRQRDILLIFILLLGIAGLLMYAGLTNGHGWGDDFAGYIAQAKSITEASPRSFVDDNRFTIEQSSYPIGPVAYPWGFPLILAPLYALFGLNPVALKSVGLISYLLFLVTLWCAWRRIHSGSWFLLLVALFALNPVLLGFSNEIMSDLPFLFVSTLCMAMIRAVVVEDRRIVSRFLDTVLLGAAITSAFLLRTNGLLLLVTLGFSQLVSLRQKNTCRAQKDIACEEHGSSARPTGFPGSASLNTLAVQLAPYVVFFSSIAILGWILPEGGTSHVSHLRNISIWTIKRNLSYYLCLPSNFFSGAPYPMLIYGATIPLAIAGAVRNRRSDFPAIIYVALTLLLYVFWPSRQGIRFLFPILPFYLSFVISSLQGFCDASSTVEQRRLRRVFCYIPLVLVLLCFGMKSSRASYLNSSGNGQLAQGPFAPASLEMFSFVKNQTESGDVVVFFKPRLMRLMTGRQSVMIKRAEQLRRWDYLCLYLRRDGYNQVSEIHADSLCENGIARLIFANADFKIYRLRKEGNDFNNKGGQHADLRASLASRQD